LYQSGGTIKRLLDKMVEKEYILPAIQREFVWWPDQICKLFDSLMQGYPFGTFLFWRISPERRNEYQFYDFMLNYHDRDNYHGELLTELPNREFTAVLDGQQRMTAINIGLRGSYALKMRGKRWSSDAAFPVTYLYLNLLGKPDSETGSMYQFAFLTDEAAEKCDDTNFWFKCSRILTEDYDSLNDNLSDNQFEGDNLRIARSAMRQLYRTIHDRDVISYYEETEQSLERVLNIFIRMNSGGTPLSYSDLLLSIAVAQWSKLDARKEVNKLVDEMNDEGDGFNFTKDLVLKAGLMLSDIGSVGFKVENFNKANMAVLESNWEKIRSALLLSVRLLSSFGLNGQNLRAESSILPIAYYLFLRQLQENYLTRAEYSMDRENIRLWLIRSLLKPSGIWGSGLDTLLTALRETLKTAGLKGFPVEAINKTMDGRGKSLTFSLIELDELSELPYGDKRTFPILSMIFPGFDFSKHFHVDHIYPQGKFNKTHLRKQKIAEEILDDVISKSNRLPNLQLLEGSINNEKRQKMPNEWYERLKPEEKTRKEYLSTLEISSLPSDLSDFNSFYDARRDALRQRIALALNVT